MNLNSAVHNADIVCFSHLRWGFVFQRPQHLMSRFARERRVFFVEEPIHRACLQPSVQMTRCDATGVMVVTPVLPEALTPAASAVCLRSLLEGFLEQQRIAQYVAWFYTPMALSFADQIKPPLTVYDCMDELSLFRGAPPELCRMEQQLLERADLVFTGGASLFEAKRSRHPQVYAFPSGVDVEHFRQARSGHPGFQEQERMRRPRLGYAGVIDERVDLDLIDRMAAERPEWEIVMIGPVVKIDAGTLPRRSNIHWLGMKDYRDLPQYFAGWDVGLLPFAMNESTRFISPTKTPEYLSAGLQVVSTPVRDVVRPYGELGYVHIGSNPDEFIAACDICVSTKKSAGQTADIDTFLRTASWDETWKSMDDLLKAGCATAGRKSKTFATIPVPQLQRESMNV